MTGQMKKIKLFLESVPILIFMGIPTNIAVATSANQIVASSISGTIGYWRQGLVDFKMGGVLLNLYFIMTLITLGEMKLESL